MKTKSLLVVALTVVIFTVGWTVASSLTPNSDSERAQLPVLKVFSAKDEKAVFRAYLVKWKSQEVIVPDTLVNTDYKEGDNANVLVMKHKYPNDKSGPELLSFALVPVRP